MKSAWLMGLMGGVASYWVGTHFGLGTSDVVWALVASNVAGVLSLLSTLALEREPWVKRNVMNRSLMTWLVLAVLYCSLLAVLSPALRDPRILAGLFAPLVLGTGFTLPVFGVLQDRIVRRAQRKARAR